MRQRCLLLVAGGVFFTTLLASDTSRSPLQGVLYDFPLTFEENRGQAESRFDYVARGPGYGLYLSAGEILFGLRHGASREAFPEVFRMRLAGGLPGPAVHPLEAAATKSHYIWATIRQNGSRTSPTTSEFSTPKCTPGSTWSYTETPASWSTTLLSLRALPGNRFGCTSKE